MSKQYHIGNKSGWRQPILKLLLVYFVFLLFLPVVILYLGYAITLACSITFAALIIFTVLSREEIKKELSKSISIYSLIALSAIVLFFLIFSLFFLKETELIFFDEQIYQSIALNIMRHGTALTCIFGTAQLNNCYVNALGFDPAGWPFIIAIAFELFGVGPSTAHGLEIFLSAASIVAIFLLASLLTRKKEIPVMSALIFSLIPEIFIWAKTLANPNTPFMLFFTLTVFFFVLFAKTRTRSTLALSLFSIIFTSYIRVEALLLVFIFLIILLTFGEKGVKRTILERVKLIYNKEVSNSTLLLFVISTLLLVPQIANIFIGRSELHIAASSFLSPNAGLFSLSYLPKIAFQNTLFLLGRVSIYPIIFLPGITVFAILGVVTLVFSKKQKDRFSILLLLLSLFFCYFILYGLYFSGSAFLGGSVRFLLILYPSLSILAAFGVYGTSELLVQIAKKHYKNGQIISGRHILYTAIIIVFFIAPFAYIIHFLRSPNYLYPDFPIIANAIPQNDPYAMLYANMSLAFINSNYNLVPANCLVFSPSPYFWYQLNRSAAYVYEYNSSESHLKDYSCFVLDYSWFCGNPFDNLACNAILSKYKLKILATESGDITSNFSLYQLLNYTPN